MWIYTTIYQSLLKHVLKPNIHTRHVWVTLEKLFWENKESNLMQLDNELRSITMGDLSVATYTSKIQNSASLIENLDVDSKVKDKYLVKYMINSLSSRFSYISTILHHNKPLPSFQDARSMLALEEQCLLILCNRSPTPHIDHPSSLYVLHAGSNDSTRNYRQDQGNDSHRSDNRR